MKSNSELNALISLLEDDDPEIYKNISAKIISYGQEVIPILENAWIDQFNPDIHAKISDIIHVIQFTSFKQKLQEWIEDPFVSLLEGYLLVCQYQYPDINRIEVLGKLDKVKKKIWLELNNNFTPLENINVFNQVFYSILRFNGSYNRKSNTQDYYLNSILESKRGNSISLGLLYLILAQQVELPVYGVCLYRHFILAYQKNHVFDYNEDNQEDTLFYMNPMNKGVSFYKKEIREYLKSMQVEENPIYFNPASPKALIYELLSYLRHHHKARKDFQREEELNELLLLF